MAHLGRCTLFVGCFHFKGWWRGQVTSSSMLAFRHRGDILPPLFKVHRGYSYKDRGIPSSLGWLARILHFPMKLTLVPAHRSFSFPFEVSF